MDRKPMTLSERIEYLAEELMCKIEDVWHWSVSFLQMALAMTLGVGWHLTRNQEKYGPREPRDTFWLSVIALGAIGYVGLTLYVLVGTSLWGFTPMTTWLVGWAGVTCFLALAWYLLTWALEAGGGPYKSRVD